MQRSANVIKSANGAQNIFAHFSQRESIDLATSTDAILKISVFFFSLCITRCIELMSVHIKAIVTQRARPSCLKKGGGGPDDL